MKVNDIVVLKNGLNSFYLVLEVEKHLFEIDDDVAIIKSLSTGVKIRHKLESIRLATLKERYLREGYLLELKGGYKVLTTKTGAFDDGGYLKFTYYNDDLKCDIDNNEIIKVYKLEDVGMVDWMLETDNHKLIWQRKPKIELTDDEKVILNNLDDKYDAIERTERGGLRLRFRVNHLTYVSYVSFNGYDNLFKSITHESGVHEIKDLLE